jgi:hypothetical protein
MAEMASCFAFGGKNDSGFVTLLTTRHNSSMALSLLAPLSARPR